ILPQLNPDEYADQQSQANGSQNEVRNWDPIFVTTPTLYPEYLHCNQQFFQ
ncbi:2242_t:CDS:2, partial [Dentiscutata heterogama]